MERPTAEECKCKVRQLADGMCYCDTHEKLCSFICPVGYAAEIDALQAENATLQQQLREVKESSEKAVHSWRTEADRLANELNARVVELHAMDADYKITADSLETRLKAATEENARLIDELEQLGRSVYNAAKNYAVLKQHAESLEGRLAMAEADSKANPHLPGCDHFALPACHCREAKCGL